jgi:hypothetical protein
MCFRKAETIQLLLSTLDRLARRKRTLRSAAKKTTTPKMERMANLEKSWKGKTMVYVVKSQSVEDLQNPSLYSPCKARHFETVFVKGVEGGYIVFPLGSALSDVVVAGSILPSFVELPRVLHLPRGTEKEIGEVRCKVPYVDFIAIERPSSPSLCMYLLFASFLFLH